MQITNHRLEGVPFLKSKHFGREITPTLVLLHDTAGRLEAQNSAEYLCDNPAKVSAHFVVERDGSITQLVETNRRANHAGKSNYHGCDHVNGFSIGIEIVNPGRMNKVDERQAITWFKQRFSIADSGIRYVKTREHGGGHWMDYTAEQITAVEDLLQALFDAYSSLEDIRGHWYVSPGRKCDPNPLFPMEPIRSRVFGRIDPSEIVADKSAEDAGAADLVQIDVPGSALNLRRWPSFNPNVFAQIPDKVVVPVLRTGTFNGRDWLKVAYDSREGWIVASYAAAITHTIPKLTSGD